MAKQNMKRIHKVVIRHMQDDAPDTSDLGEYANKPTSRFSIDRAHDLDCPQQTYNQKPTQDAIELLERAIAHLENVKEGCRRKNVADKVAGEDLEQFNANDYAQDILVEAQDSIATDRCTCRNELDYWDNRELRYFNPSFKGEPNGVEPEDVIKYVRQDYERMEGLSNGDWIYIGILAQAEWSIQYSIKETSTNLGPMQVVSSGGAWGIESDSDNDYIASIESEELAELRSQLHAIGFSQRAITAAFRNIEMKGDR
jgi:hypothetical protein